jgi:hypothetical protein
LRYKEMKRGEERGEEQTEEDGAFVSFLCFCGSLVDGRFCPFLSLRLGRSSGGKDGVTNVRNRGERG